MEKAMTFPAEWGLSMNEARLLQRLAAGDVATFAELGEIAGKRPVRVQMHYLRKKVDAHGIAIVSVRSMGYQASTAAQHILSTYARAAS